MALAAGCLAPPAVTAGQSVQERLGYPAGAKLLIIHADDLGMSHSVNRATFEALERGWTTSSSILVPCPWFAEVAAWARAHQNADLGIHLAVNSEWTSFRWGPVSGREAVPSLLDKDGYLPLLENEVVRHAQPPQVERELRAQVDMAKAAGISPTHLDPHMATLFQTQALSTYTEGRAPSGGSRQGAPLENRRNRRSIAVIRSRSTREASTLSRDAGPAIALCSEIC